MESKTTYNHFSLKVFCLTLGHALLVREDDKMGKSKDTLPIRTAKLWGQYGLACFLCCLARRTRRGDLQNIWRWSSPIKLKYWKKFEKRDDQVSTSQKKSTPKTQVKIHLLFHEGTRPLLNSNCTTQADETDLMLVIAK
jgi:hypothetical protein